MNCSINAVLAVAIPLIAACGSWITTGELNAPEVALTVTGFVTAILVYYLRQSANRCPLSAVVHRSGSDTARERGVTGVRGGSLQQGRTGNYRCLRRR
jgi:hypothetical protein